MRPAHLEMDGFGAFRSPTTVDFRDIDLVALVGATGSGKSTIIDAITFALYGTVARYDDNRLVAPVINQVSAQARVRLDFELGGREYTAVRVVRRTRAGGATVREARLERDGEVLAGDAKGMTREVERLLGLDADQFNRTVVLPQGEFAAFLHDTPASRQATLRRLLGLEMYQRIGQQSRSRAARARSHIDALQPDVNELEGRLTDKHRSELVTAIEQMGELRTHVREAGLTIAARRVEIATFEDTLSDFERDIHLLASVITPDGLAELERVIAEAAASRDRAETDLAATRTSRHAATIALENGPNLVRCTEQLGLRRAALALEAESEALATDFQAARERAESTTRDADSITAKQAELDEAVALAREREDEARRAVQAGPDLVQVTALLHLRARRTALADDLVKDEAAATSARTVLEPLAAELARSIEAADRARRHLEKMRQLAGVAAHAGLLVVGEPCPLCEQKVHRLPTRELGGDLRDAEVAAEAASSHAQSALSDRDKAQASVNAAVALVTARTDALTTADAELVGVAPHEELQARQVEAKRLQELADQAANVSRDASSAADTCRSAPENLTAIKDAAKARDIVTGLSARADGIAVRLATARGSLVDVPPQDELEAAIAEAQRLADDRRKADEDFSAAERASSAAADELRRVESEARSAEQQLTEVRGRLATLSPPSRSDAGLLMGWTELASWASQRSLQLDEQRRHVDSEKTIVEEGIKRIETDIRDRSATVIDEVSADTDLTALSERLVAHEAQAQGALRRFDEERTRLDDLRARINDLRTSAGVAEKLGHLMRADGFERWLMSSALRRLVADASVRLSQLSGGQYSLIVDDGSFAVRDHANADEIRRVRTLSGGETFLASLSLALALAEATAELAPEGTPTIESIFLDEGFGTLDPEALDTVATAIEELGATGRLVGIVTHIRDLADRMPVRLEVTKMAATSTVERVEI